MEDTRKSAITVLFNEARDLVIEIMCGNSSMMPVEKFILASKLMISMKMLNRISIEAMNRLRGRSEVNKREVN